MAQIPSDFGSGGANLTPEGQGKPALVTVLLDIASDLALAAGASRYAEETIPVSSNVGLLYYPAEIIEVVDNAGASVAQVASTASPGAGEFKVDSDRRTLTFGDAISSAIVGYQRKMETAAFVESAAETYALNDGETLLVEVDGGAEQTATFNTGDFGDIANATAAEIVAVLNADLTGATAEARGTKVVLRSDTTGADSSIEVTGGTGNGALAFPTTLAEGTGVKTAAL